MKEKLLALLVTKFKGVSEATLERIATKKAGSVTDESQLQSIADGIEFDQIVQSEVDARTKAANKKAIENYEKQHNLKEGKVIEPGDSKPDSKPDPDSKKGDDVAALIKSAISEAISPIQEKLSAYEKKEKTGLLTTKLMDRLIKDEKIPEKEIKAFKLLNGVEPENEDDFDGIVENIKAQHAESKQSLIDDGLYIDNPGSSRGEVADSISVKVAEDRNTSSNADSSIKSKEI